MNYRQRVISEYQSRAKQYEAENLNYGCLNCEGKTEWPESLCVHCEAKLVQALDQVGRAIQWLTIMGEVEATSVSSPNGGGKHSASETSNLTPASMLADEIEALTKRFAWWVWDEIGSSEPSLRYPGAKSWRGHPIAGMPPGSIDTYASYLKATTSHLVRRPWVPMLINGYRDAATGEQIRGLNALLAEQRAKWPTPEQKEPARHLDGLPCLACGQETLWLHPAQVAGQPIAINCHHRTDEGEPCGWHCREDAQDFLINMADLFDQIHQLANSTPNQLELAA